MTRNVTSAWVLWVATSLTACGVEDTIGREKTHAETMGAAASAGSGQGSGASGSGGAGATGGGGPSGSSTVTGTTSTTTGTGSGGRADAGVDAATRDAVARDAFVADRGAGATGVWVHVLNGCPFEMWIHGAGKESVLTP